MNKKMPGKLVAILAFVSLLLSARPTYAIPLTFTAISVGAQQGALTQGTAGNATYLVTVSRSGSGNLTVALSVTSTLPTGAAYSFNPSSVSFSGATPLSATSTLTITTTSSTPGSASGESFTIEGQSGGTARTATGTLSITIVKTDPTLSLTNSPVAYNGSAQSATVVGSVAGTVNNVTYNGSSTPPTNAGTYAVTADFSPTDTTHYNTLTAASAGNFIITKAAATISVSSYSVNYDGNSHSASGTATGAGGADLTSSLDLSGTTHTHAGAYNDAWSFVGGTNYQNASGTVSNTISKSDATITITGYTGVYDGLLHGILGTAVGVAQELLSGLNLGSLFAYVPGGTASWSFADATGNYNDASGNGAVILSKKTLRVSATGVNKTYDGSTSATVILSDDRISGDDLTFNYTAEFATSSVGSGIAITVSGLSLSGASAGNYELAETSLSTSADITQDAGSITLDKSLLTRIYDGTPQTVNVLSTSPIGLSYLLTYNGSSTPPTIAGKYSLVATIADPNYSGSDTAELIINKADQSITFDPLTDKTTEDADFTLSATASSSLPVSFAASSTACTVSDSTVHIVTKGVCSITASQIGNVNYNAASDVLRTFTVADVTAPVLTLHGSSTMNILIADTYTEPGASSTDAVDGDVAVTIGGDTVTTTAAAVFHITYTATDSSGNIASTTRTVNVSETPAPVLSGQTAASISTQSITLHWTTDHPATSRAIYDIVSHNPITGSAPNYGYASSTAEDSALVTSHSVTISGLIPGTTYYLRSVSHGSPEAVGDETTASTSVASTPAPQGSGGGSGTYFTQAPQTVTTSATTTSATTTTTPTTILESATGTKNTTTQIDTAPTLALSDTPRGEVLGASISPKKEEEELSAKKPVADAAQTSETDEETSSDTISENTSSHIAASSFAASLANIFSLGTDKEYVFWSVFIVLFSAISLISYRRFKE